MVMLPESWICRRPDGHRQRANRKRVDGGERSAPQLSWCRPSTRC